MTDGSFFSPENARIIIPVTLAALYFIYHLRNIVSWTRSKLRKRAARREQLRYEKEVRREEAELAQRLAQRDRDAMHGKLKTLPTAAPETPAAEAEAHEPAAADALPAEETKSDADAADETPQQRWKRARTITHSYVPDMESDAEYLSLVQSAALDGHGEACAKLAEYSSRRGAMVETYFWLKLAKRFGHPDLDTPLTNLRREWMLQGEPDEYENVYALFPEALGSVARNALRLDCGVNAPFARQRLKDLEDMGVAEARLMHGYVQKAG